MNLQYEVNTHLFPDDKIIQEVWMLREEIRTKIWTDIVDLQEAGVRKALIEAGWTPPDVKEAND